MGDLLGLAVYNPAILSDAAFLASFVARGDLVERLLGRLAEIGADGLASHHLILGQRGMGKTSILRRLAIGVRDTPALSTVLLPLSFREEQYNVHNLHVFWCNCLDALGDWFERTGQPEQAAAVDREVALLTGGKPDPEGDEALEVFRRWVRQEGRRPLLLLDNLDIILAGLSRQQWSLRRVLQQAGGIVVVGASAAYLEATADREAAFYDFFQVTVLERLDQDELLTCLRRLAITRGDQGVKVQTLLDTDPGRIRTLYDLTGGNPRTLTLLYLLLETDTDGDVLGDLERLLDQVTVLYKARVEDLAPQTRVVLDAVALAWNPVIAADLATATGLPTTTVSTQLDRLQKDGVVEKVSVSTSSRAAFQVSERFFNIWYLMRHGPRRQRLRLRWLTEFLRGLYTPGQLRDRAKDLLQDTARHGQERGHYYLALSEAMGDPAWRTLLASEARREIEQYVQRSGKRLEEVADLSDLPIPVSAEDWNLQGYLLHVELKRYGEAEAAYRKAIELDPRFAWPWINLANLLQDLHRCEEAEAAYGKAIERGYPNWSWRRLVKLLLRTGRFAEVEADYRTAIATDPDAARWDRLGNLLECHPIRYPEAEAAYRRAIEIDPAGATYQGDLARLLVRYLGRFAEAETFCRQALALDPSNDLLWRELGYLLLYLLGRTDEAADAYQQALMIDPANLSTQRHLLTARLIQPAYQDDQELDFDAIVGRRRGAGADLLRAIRAIAQDNFGTAQDSFAAALSSDQTVSFLISRGRVVLFLRQAAQRGYGDRLLAALSERGLADRHWPLQAAFDAYLHGEARLKDVNPEVRGAARRIYDWLDAPRRQNRKAQQRTENLTGYA